jgi:hypothetical protein
LVMPQSTPSPMRAQSLSHVYSRVSPWDSMWQQG